MSYELRQALERVARRFRQVRLWAALALCWLAWGGVGAALLWASDRGTHAPPDGRLVAAFVLLAAVTGLACAAVALRSARDRRWVARRIEARHPDLGTGLLAAVEEDAAARGRLGYLQAAVVKDVLRHRLTHNWDSTVPNWKLRGAKLAHLAALALLIVVSFSLAGQARSRPVGGPAASKDAASGLHVEPGDAEIERGTPLLVVARFSDRVPNEAALVVEDGSASAGRRTMTRSLEDPTFAGRVEAVERDLSYRIEYDGKSSQTYRVTVFEYPEVLRTDAHLVFPAYTALEPKTVEDVRHVTAVEGTQLTLTFRLNKAVKTARLLDEQGRATPLTPGGSAEHACLATFTLTDPQRLKVELIDEQGRPNKSPTEIAINVVRNKPPTVAVTRPARDVRVSPVEELSLAAKLEDDFGVVRHGVTYSVAGREPKEVVLGDTANAKRVEAAHLLDFESFAAEPDQLVSYYFWAEDVGPDGRPRRSSGDMFFAEVRPFEEVFRQGQQPSAGQQQQGRQGNARQATQLAELQKQIINGTWKLIRRETGAKPSEKFAPDAQTLLDSQRSAIEQAAPLGERLQDPASKAKLDQATGLMNDAVKHLTEAAESPKIAALQPALAAEQAAYQALLKLRDREFQVVRGQQQQGGGSSAGGPSQRQLQQLELSNEENRYEQRRSAQPEQASQEDQQQAEMRQVLNRLRELAQRQADLNERLKELQSALEAAQDEQTMEELRRQLKRLREQQQQILRDTDELRERMESEQNRERMADARQQAEQAREHVRQASEALEEGRLSQALTEGTRAGRQLENLKEEMRKETSSRFSEEMKQMRDQARQVADAQDKLSERLEQLDSGARRSLRDGDDRKEIREGLAEQQKQLGQLLDRMRGTVREAEEAEPLLAEKLFDAVQKAERNAIPEALKAADRLTDLGITEEAAKASRHAGQGLEELKQGVEEAAESVLGDETQMLKRAQGELEDLADQIDREVSKAGGESQSQTGDRSRPGRGDEQQPQAGSRSGEPPAEGTAPADSGQQNARQGDSGRPTDNPDAQNPGRPGQGERQPGEDSPQDRQQGEANSRRDGEPGQRGQQDRNAQNQSGGRQGERQQGGQPQQNQSGQQQGDGQPDQQNQDGQQNGQQQNGQQQGGRQQESQQQGGQGGQQQGGRQEGNQQQGNQQGGQGQGGNSLRDQPGGRRPGDRQGSPNGGRLGGLEQLLEQGVGPGGPGGPITGEGFREWSDRMRDVEELLDAPELRAEAARIRDRVRGAREEFKRHSKEPDPKALQDLVAAPLHELRDRVAQEVRRREAPDSLVPIDRDPVPPAFAEGVRRYYERLGSGR